MIIIVSVMIKPWVKQIKMVIDYVFFIGLQVQWMLVSRYNDNHSKNSQEGNAQCSISNKSIWALVSCFTRTEKTLISVGFEPITFELDHRSSNKKASFRDQPFYGHSSFQDKEKSPTHDEDLKWLLRDLQCCCR